MNNAVSDGHALYLLVLLPLLLDAAGRGAVYSYDAIGSYERTGYSCQGSGKDLMQPVLDNQLKAASPLLVPPRVRGCQPGCSTHWLCALLSGCIGGAGRR